MYLAFDCETGGLDSQTCSLLTIGFVIADDNFNIVQELEYRVRHDVYNISPKALEINGINIIEHDKTAKYLEYVREAAAFEFLKKFGVRKATPVGKNVHFDIQFLLANVFTQRQWSSYVSHHCFELETFAVLHKVNTLEELANVYKVNYDKSALHTCLGDARLAINVAKAVVDVFRSR